MVRLSCCVYIDVRLPCVWCGSGDYITPCVVNDLLDIPLILTVRKEHFVRRVPFLDCFLCLQEVSLMNYRTSIISGYDREGTKHKRSYLFTISGRSASHVISFFPSPNLRFRSGMFRERNKNQPTNPEVQHVRRQVALGIHNDPLPPLQRLLE